MSLRVVCASQAPGPGPPRPEYRVRYGAPCDEVHGVQARAVASSVPGGKKASGGSHSLAGSRVASCGGGSTPPRSSGAVEVAPDALGCGSAAAPWPARVEAPSSGGLARRQRDVTPAAERSRAPPPRVARGGWRRVPGPGPPLHERGVPRRGPVPRPEPGTRSPRDSAEASWPWCLHSQWRMGPCAAIWATVHPKHD